jgi:hypothetical protein
MALNEWAKKREWLHPTHELSKLLLVNDDLQIIKSLLSDEFLLSSLQCHLDGRPYTEFNQTKWILNSMKYMLLSCHQNTGQNHNIKIANRSFENVAQFKYLELH